MSSKGSSKKYGNYSKNLKRDTRHVKRGVVREFRSIGKGVVNGLLDLLLFRR